MILIYMYHTVTKYSLSILEVVDGGGWIATGIFHDCSLGDSERALPSLDLFLLRTAVLKNHESLFQRAWVRAKRCMHVIFLRTKPSPLTLSLDAEK